MLIAAIPAVVALGLLPPLDSAGAPPARPAAVRAGSPAPTTSISLDAFGPALDRPLHAMPDDPAAPSATTPAEATLPAVSPKALQLVGTVGSTIALVKGPDGAVAIVEVGDDVEGADVVAIRDQQLELRQNGRLFRLEKDPGKPNGDETIIR